MRNIKDQILLTTEEVAAMIDCTKSYVYELSSAGELDSAKIVIGHRTVRYDRDAILAWIDSKRVKDDD